MPITQSRMIALITAAENILAGLEESMTMVKACLREAERTGDAMRELRILANNIDPRFMVRNPIETLTLLAVEKRHFQINRSRNEAAARWHAKQRHGSAGGTSRLPKSGPSAGPIHERVQVVTTRTRTKSKEPRQVKASSSQTLTEHEPAPNLAWDETDPENAFAEGQDLTSLLAPARQVSSADLDMYIDPDDKKQIEREASVFGAPEGHYSSFLNCTATEDSDGDLIACQCGFKGPFTSWEAHLPAGTGTVSQDESDGS